MRVISGKYRGLNLAKFEGKDIRPTADRVKESLFNIIYDKVVGATVLDLFCGSGNLGIECLSRGAEFVQFNDISKDSIAVLKKNLGRLKCDNYKISNLDFSDCLSNCGKFDIIFIDPPYASDAGVYAISKISSHLTEGGIVIFERDRQFSEEISSLFKYDERKYGKTYLSFFKSAKENVT